MGGRGAAAARAARVAAAAIAAASVTGPLAAGAASASAPAPAAAASAPAAAPSAPAAAPGQRASISGAYRFLSEMMDRYAKGRVPRLVQSFAGGTPGRRHYTASQTYDDAVVIDAYLAQGTAAGQARASVIGAALLDAQAADPAADGRLRASYAPRPLLRPRDIRAVDGTTDAGAMAWAGLALTRLYAATGRARFLRGALRIGRWIQAHCRDSRGAGGYTGGYSASGHAFRWKSTEQNIDDFSLFRMLAAATGDPPWRTRAARARRFVTAMWDAARGRFYAGTTANGRSVNDSERPEDVNTWSYLALGDPARAASVSWDARHLAVRARGLAGVSFCAGDRSGVWFEGTAHLAAALLARGRPGDARRARGYLADIAAA